MRPQGKYHKLITASSHTVKVWKLFEKKQRRVVEEWGECEEMAVENEEDSSVVCVRRKEEFKNQSFSPINSCGVTQNEEYMYTSDEGQMLLWSL